MPHQNFLTFLIQEELLSESDADKVTEDHKAAGGKLSTFLVENNYLTEDQYLSSIAKYMGMPVFDLKDFKFSAELLQFLPEKIARQFGAILLYKEDGYIYVGVTDPSNLAAQDELRRVIGKPVKFAAVQAKNFTHVIDTIYRRTADIEGYADVLKTELSGDTLTGDDVHFEADSPVTKLLQSIFEDAIQVGASDIHIEPAETALRIRLRVDGVLQEQILNQKEVSNALIVRLKLMSGLDISEKRIPQDGRLRFHVNKVEYDARLSILPTQYGESAVMRILDKSGSLKSLDKLGMTQDQLKRFNQWLSVSNGIILVTGPTGSGKTTTLYSALKKLNTADVKILTAEDPIEYHLDRICQVQVNTKVGLTFSSVLRSALRQDPDLILVGEMRDQETATIAVRAALTGHLVLSTLHTNDAGSSPLRLVDMGIEGFLVTATIRGILAQRLVRQNCHVCIKPDELSEEAIIWLKESREMTDDDIEQLNPQIGHGCAHCHHTGYAGRAGIYELFEFSPAMSEALREADQEKYMDEVEKEMKGRSMVDHGLQLVKAGKTSIEEVIRVLGGY